MESKTFITGLVAGIAAGVTIGIVIANSSEETQKKIIDVAKKIGGIIKDTATDVVGGLGQKYLDAAESAGTR